MSRVAFHTRAFFDVLLRKSREEGRKDRQRGVDIALMALDSVNVSTEILEDDARILRAQAGAWIGNARRLALEFPGAEQAFHQAEIELGYRSGKSALFVKAEILDYRSALRLDQRRFQEALDLAALAVPIFRELDNLHRYVQARISRARILCYSGDSKAIGELGEALEDLVRKPESRLELSALSLLATAQALNGQKELARSTVDRAKKIAGSLSDLSVFPSLDWVDGLVASAEGVPTEAEALLTLACEGFRRCGDIGSRAGVALDLAILYDDQGRYSKVKSALAEALPILLKLKIDREASKALALLEKATTPEQSACSKPASDEICPSLSRPFASPAT